MLRVTFLSALVLELLGTIGTAIIAVEIGLRLMYGRFGFESAFFILLLAPEFYFRCAPLVFVSTPVCLAFQQPGAFLKCWNSLLEMKRQP